MLGAGVTSLLRAVCKRDDDVVLDDSPASKPGSLLGLVVQLPSDKPDETEVRRINEVTGNMDGWQRCGQAGR